MALPHFPGNGYIKEYDPVYLSLKYVHFEDKELFEHCIGIKKDRIFFNVNVVDNKISPLDNIINKINNKDKLLVDVPNNSRMGKIIFKIILHNFQFISINNLLDFNLCSTDKKDELMRLDVTYTFERVEYINLLDPLTERAMKINKIVKRDNSNISLKLTKEQLGL